MNSKKLKWAGIVFLSLLGVGVVYLAVQPDPGPYIVALRSDTPEQVAEALDSILSADTMITYKGRAYPPLQYHELAALGLRYFRKATGQSQEPLKGDTATWMNFADRMAPAIQGKKSTHP